VIVEAGTARRKASRRRGGHPGGATGVGGGAREKTILFNLSGHGLTDLAGYEMYFAGQLVNHELGEDELQHSLDAMQGQLQVTATSSGRWG
jgi:hypothetical protein